MRKISILTITSGTLLAISTLGFSVAPLFFDRPLIELQDSIDSLNKLAQEVWEDQLKALTHYENVRVQRDHTDILKSINADTKLIDRMEKELVLGLRTTTINAIGVTLEAKVITEQQFNEAVSEVNKLNSHDELGPIFIKYLSMSGQGWEKLKRSIESGKKEYRNLLNSKNLWTICSIVIQTIGLLLGLVNISFKKYS